MAFIEKKINGYRVSISGLSDTPSADGVSAAQLKALFDGRTDEEVLRAVNGLVDELLGPEAAAQIGERAGTVQQALYACVRSGDIRGIRVGGDNFIEITRDGQSWQAAGSGGHLVVDGQGNALPQRSRLRFENTEVRDRGGETVVSAVRGEKGEKGDPGPRGERGEQGFRGEAGKAWLPDVDSGGTLRFTLSDARTPPAPVSLRGPQGVPGAQGVQGAQGPAGPRGIQGEQGPAGPQGARGPSGADGRDFRVLGLYADLPALQRAHPAGGAGDAWAVGTAERNTVYLWDTDAQAWRDIGAMQGPPGPQGVQGVPGAQGPEGVQGPAGPAGESAYRQACAAGYTGGEPAFSQSLSALPGHLGAEDNPHGVTAAQTGAFSRQESLLGSWQSGGAEAVWDWVACGGGRFVRLRAQSDAAQSSADGLRWTEERLPLPGSWIQPCCGAAGFVTLAAGRADAALSPDGRGWRQTALPCASQWEAVCFGGGYYVAVGSSPSALVFSRDGVLWQRAEGLPDDVPWSAVCHGADRFVALSGTAESPARTAAFSLDGRRWQTAELPRTAAWTAVRHGPEGFAALPAAGAQGARSPDGISWESFAVQDGEGFCALEYSGGLLLALPSGSADGLFASQNGQSWEKLPLPQTARWRSLCSDGEITLLAGGSAFARARAPLSAPQSVAGAVQRAMPGRYGTGWRQMSAPGGAAWTFADYCEDRYVALAAAESRAAWSYDGENWNLLRLPSAGGWQRICYGGGKYVVYGAENSARVLVSSDGAAWTEGALPGADNWRMCRGGGYFVAVGALNGLGARSADGLTWEESAIPKSTWGDVLYDGKSYRAVTTGNKIAASSLDGLTWSYRQLPGAQQWRKMGYGAGKYVVVGDSADFTLWSEDGLSWTRVPLPGGRVRKLKSVCWTGERFVAVEGGGENGVLLSTDGLGWREGTPLPGADGAESLCCGPRPMAVSAGRILLPGGALAAEEAVRAAVDGLSYALYGEHTGAAVTGTYTGNGVRAADADGGQRIALGFRPRAVLVRPQTVSSDGAGCLMAVREAPAMSDDGLALLSVTAYGFLAGEHRSTTRFVNADGAVYLYTAIR